MRIIEVITQGPQGPPGLSNTGSLATTGSNTFYGLQTISASNTSPSVLDIHAKDDGLWAFRVYNDTYSSSSIGLASWMDNTGISFLGTETDKPLYIYNNGQINNYQPTLLISSSGVTVSSLLTVSGKVTASSFTGSLQGTSSWATNSLTASYVDSLNQTLIITGSTQGNTVALSITSNTASLNLSLASFYTLQLVQGTNIYINPSNFKPGQSSMLLVSTTGSATVSFPSFVKQPSGSSYIPTTTTGTDILTFASLDNTNLYLVNVKNLI
jgi:hypothetical protein